MTSSAAVEGGLPEQLPAGPRHAVPHGSRMALCGAMPRLVWAGSAWPDGTAMPEELCLTCTRLAVDHGKLVAQPYRRRSW